MDMDELESKLRDVAEKSGLSTADCAEVIATLADEFRMRTAEKAAAEEC